MSPQLTLPACCLAILCVMSPRLDAQRFVAGCPFPWGEIAELHPIDGSCSINGQSKVPEKIAESRAKNYLCAAGDPTAIEYDTLIELQQAVDRDHTIHLSDRETPSRPTKAYDTSKGSLKEGNLVSLAAWVLLARNSNIKNGENVSC
jgi:hypothetical protein